MGLDTHNLQKQTNTTPSSKIIRCDLTIKTTVTVHKIFLFDTASALEQIHNWF